MGLLIKIWRGVLWVATTLLGQRAAAPTQVQAEQRSEDIARAQTADAASARTTIADTAAAQAAATQETARVKAASDARDDAAAGQLRAPDHVRDRDEFSRD